MPTVPEEAEAEVAMSLVPTTWTETTTPTAADLVETMASLLSSARSTTTSVHTYHSGIAEEQQHNHQPSASEHDDDYSLSPPIYDSAAAAVAVTSQEVNAGTVIPLEPVQRTRIVTLAAMAAGAPTSSASRGAGLSNGGGGRGSLDSENKLEDDGEGNDVLGALATEVERSSAWLMKPAATLAGEVNRSSAWSANPPAIGASIGTTSSTTTAPVTATATASSPMQSLASAVFDSTNTTGTTTQPSAETLSSEAASTFSNIGRFEVLSDLSESDLSDIMTASIVGSKHLESPPDVSLANSAIAAATVSCGRDLLGTSFCAAGEESAMSMRNSACEGESEASSSPGGKAWTASRHHVVEGRPVEVEVQEEAATWRYNDAAKR